MSNYKSLQRVNEPRRHKRKMLKRSASASVDLLSSPNYNKKSAVRDIEKERRLLDGEIGVHKPAVTKSPRGADRVLFDIPEDVDDGQQTQTQGTSGRSRRLTPSADVAWLCFLWRATAVETWIRESERRLLAVNPKCDTLPAVLVFLRKQSMFAQRLKAYETKGVAGLFHLKCDLSTLCDSTDLSRRNATIAKYDELMSKWYDLWRKSDGRKAQLMRTLQKCKAKKLQEQFAVRAEKVRSWFATVNDDLSQPKANSLNERSDDKRKSLSRLQQSMEEMKRVLQALGKLNEQVKRFDVSSNPYTDITMESLDSIWENLMKVIKQRKLETLDQSEPDAEKGDTDAAESCLHRLWRSARNRI